MMKVSERTRPETAARRTVLGLLPALAVTLGGVAAPLANSAHAGGARGGVVDTVSAAANFGTAGSKPGGAGDGVYGHGRGPELGMERPAVPAGDPGGGAIVTAGRKPGIIKAQ